MNCFYPKIPATLLIVRQAQSQGLEARTITQRRGGFRKPSYLGSTYSPKRVVMITGKSFSINASRQFLSGCKQKNDKQRTTSVEGTIHFDGDGSF